LTTHTARLAAQGLHPDDVRDVMLDVCKPILTQLADILEVLRVHEVVHHDLKPQNVLVIPPATPLEAPTLKVRAKEGGKR
jgi:serine/threonine protein kinase